MRRLIPALVLSLLIPGVGAAMAQEREAAAAKAAAPAAEEVTFEGFGGLTLNGTLLLPDGAVGERYPAVLLLPGSGPTDRDGNQSPVLKTDLLRQIADRLAAEGVATLRFDKRAVRSYAEHWPKDPAEMGEFFAWDRFVGDAAGAYRWLRGHDRVVGSRVAILGHSEGGLIALQIAADMAGEEDRPAGLILAGTAGRVLDEVLREQIAAALRQQTQDEQVRASYMASLEEAIAAAKAGDPLPKAMPPGLVPLFNPSTARLLRAYFTVDPEELAEKVKGPVLIVQGGLDAQISAERDTPRLLGALMKRPDAAVDSLIVPDASHNLKAVDPDAEPRQPGFAGPVAPGALDRIASWCRDHLVRPSR